MVVMAGSESISSASTTSNMRLSVPIHSFVDLITNSSSEVFIYSGPKSVCSVREILLQLAEIYNLSLETQGDTSTPRLTRESVSSKILMDKHWDR